MQLLRIEEELGDQAVYAGEDWRPSCWIVLIGWVYTGIFLFSFTVWAFEIVYPMYQTICTFTVFCTLWFFPGVPPSPPPPSFFFLLVMRAFKMHLILNILQWMELKYRKFWKCINWHLFVSDMGKNTWLIWQIIQLLWG